MSQITDYYLKLDCELEKSLYITVPHNHALFAWDDFYHLNNHESFNIITVDHHLDFSGPDTELHNAFLEERISKEEYFKQVYNGGFIPHAISMNLVKDIIVISPKSIDDDSNIQQIQSDEHKILHFDQIHNLYGTRGFFTDLVDINPSRNRFQQKKIVLDIDFDYFTYKWNHNLYPLHPSIIKDEFCLHSRLDIMNLFDIVSVISISVENSLFTGPFEAMIDSFWGLLDGIQYYFGFEYDRDLISTFIRQHRESPLRFC